MENPKTPETLEAEDPGEKSPKEASGSFGMSENGSGLAPVSDISIVGNSNDLGIENVELETQIVEGEKITDGSEFEKGSLVNDDCVDTAREEKIDSNVPPSRKAENESRSEGKLGDFGSYGIEDADVKDLVQDEDKQLETKGIDSSRMIEVSTEGISLVVEISGSPSGHIHKDVDVGNCSLLTESKEKLDEEQGKDIDNRECDFLIGDMVWVQTRNQTWWPGKIHDPVDAPKYATRTGQGDYLLVGYYGISHFAWCCPSQLRPFHENFKQMAGENRARIFVGAVEKALDEFGRRVKVEMTCSCALTRNKPLAGEASVVKGVLKPELTSGGLGDFSVTSFEPVTFLEHLKYLAEIVSLPHMLDFTVTHNRLSAFYRSIGHKQLPTHSLAERDETEEDKVSGLVSNAAEEGFVSGESRKRKMKKDSEAKVEDIAREREGVIEKGFNSRERKKSRDSGSKVEEIACEKGGVFDKGFNSGERKKSHSEAKVEDIACKKEGLIDKVFNSREQKKSRDFGAKVEDVASEKEGVMDKGFNSRERKKSRYLSYPYTNWEQKGTSIMEDPKVLNVPPQESMAAGQSNTSPSNSKCSGDKFWRKWYRRFTGDNHIPTNLELTNAASAELLTELRSAALGYLHPNGNDNFNPVCWFLSRYRISVFQEESVENEGSRVKACCSEIKAQENAQKKLPEKPKRKRTKKRENSLQGEATIHLLNVIGSMETGVRDVNESNPPSGQDSIMIKEHGRPNLGRSKTKPLSGLSDVSISIATNGLSVDYASEIDPALKNKKAKQRKQKKGDEVNGGNPRAKETTRIPDLNGSNAASSILVDNLQVKNHVTSEVRTEPLKEVEKRAGLVDLNANTSSGLLGIHGNNAKTGTLLVDLQVPGEASACLKNNHTTVLLNFAKDQLIIDQPLGEGRPGTIGQPLGEGRPATFGLSLGEGKSGRKKRKRKEKEARKNIPDLNGLGASFGSNSQEIQETSNGLTTPVKPERKRRRRKGEVAALKYPRNVSVSWRPDMNLSYNRMATNGDATRTALLLTFAPGVPMPSREDLVSAFSKFGPLRDSETRLLKDPGTAQIMFLRSADATEALKNMEINNPFGATLVNCRLHHFPAVSRPPAPNRTPGASTLGSLTQPPAVPPLDFIRQNLQMMTSMLEKSGDNLSPETRAKLEGEIKGLLSKLSSMEGSR